jgi:hypothetical protein
LLDGDHAAGEAGAPASPAPGAATAGGSAEAAQASESEASGGIKAADPDATAAGCLPGKVAAPGPSESQPVPAGAAPAGRDPEALGKEAQEFLTETDEDSRDAFTVPVPNARIAAGSAKNKREETQLVAAEAAPKRSKPQEGGAPPGSSAVTSEAAGATSGSSRRKRAIELGYRHVAQDANSEKRPTRTWTREAEGQAVCQCCGSKPPEYELWLCSYTIDSTTRVQCGNAFCGSCAGNHTRTASGFRSSFSRPHLCERHRAADAGTAESPTVQFLGSWCMDCSAGDDVTRCTNCGKALCNIHFQKTETGIKGKCFTNGKDGWCRHCHGIGNTAGFQKPREAAAMLILQTLLCVAGAAQAGRPTSLFEFSTWTEERIRTALLPLFAGRAQGNLKKTRDLAEEFGIFVYALMIGGLSVLAGRLTRVTMRLAAAMHSMGVSMLLPQQVFYMLSSDPRKLACGHSLAAALSAYGRDILLKEDERMRSRRELPAFDSAAVRENPTLCLALVAFDGAMHAPTHDLIQATAKLYAQDTSMTTTLVVRTLLTRQELEAREKMPYDTHSASVRQLIAALGERVMYICSDDSPETVILRLRELRLNVLVHIGGYNYQHFWSTLVIAQVAEVYVEWLSMASLLLCSKLACWTISSRELVTQEQSNHCNREAILYVPFPYPALAYFQDLIKQRGARPAPRRPPGLIYTGGIGRISLELVQPLVDIMFRASTDQHRICFYYQENPASKSLEIIEMVREYCRECGYPDLSDQLAAFPYYTKKEELAIYLWNHPELVAVVGGHVTPHTGCMDATHALLPTLVWCIEGSQWPGRVAREMNITLGVADELNMETRDAFIEKGVMLLTVPTLREALCTHLSTEAAKERGVFETNRVGNAVRATFTAMLDAVRTKCDSESGSGSEGATRRLEDIDSEQFYVQQRSPKFAWQDPVEQMDDPALVERHKILRCLDQVGCSIDKDVAMKILEHVQKYMALSRVAGIGKARVAIVGAWKEPGTTSASSKLKWREGKELMVKIEHKGEQGRPGYTTRSAHNSKILRSAQNLIDVKALLRNNFMQHCFESAAPTNVLGQDGRGTALGFYLKGTRAFIFEFCQPIPTTLDSSKDVAAIRRRWANEGLVDDTARWFMRAVMHLRWYLNDRVGFADMDNVLGNLAETPWATVFPKLDYSICARLPHLAWLCIVDWGGYFRIGSWKERQNLDEKASAVAPPGMKRMATATAPRANAPAPAFPRPEVGGFGFFDKQKLTEMAEHRRQRFNGIGRLDAGDHGSADPVMKAAWNEVTGDVRVSAAEAIRWQAYMSGTLIYKAVFCPRMAGQTLADYVEEQECARKSPEGMLEVMVSRLKPGVELQQPDTAALIANLLWNLMRKDGRLTEKECRLHPAVTNLVLTKQESDAVKGDGLLIGGKMGPDGTKWAKMMLPLWRLHVEYGPDNCCWGIGARADQDLKDGEFASLYVGLSVADCEGFPSGRHNVRLGEDQGFCLGELPLAVLESVGAPGVFFNAANSTHANLVLKRREAVFLQGLVYIPMYVQNGHTIRKGDFGHWNYKPFAGGGGADPYTFDDSIFHHHEPCSSSLAS